MTSTRPQTRTGAAETQQPFGSFAAISKSLQNQFAALAALPHAMIEAHLAMGSEVYGFMSRRMKAQAELCHELSQCHELTDALEAQRRFGERATSAYSDELGQIGTLLRKEMASVAQVASEAVTEANKAAKLAA